MEGKFRIEFLEEAVDFLDKLETKSREKIIYNIWKARMSDNKELFKKLSGDIWEFRTFYNRTYYRLFAFWDKTDKLDILVISTHGLIKKTGKTPLGEIEKAERIRVKYFQQKGRR